MKILTKSVVKAPEQNVEMSRYEAQEKGGGWAGSDWTLKSKKTCGVVDILVPQHSWWVNGVRNDMNFTLSLKGFLTMIMPR
jgi:hypothetical protein